MDMFPIIAKLKRSTGMTRVVPMGDASGLFRIEAEYADGWQPVLENVTRPVAQSLIEQAKSTKQVIID